MCLSAACPHRTQASRAFVAEALTPGARTAPPLGSARGPARDAADDAAAARTLGTDAPANGIARAPHDAEIAALAAEIAPASIEQRHKIHQNPELGNEERDTAALVAAHLEGLGLEVRRGIARTGVVGILKGGKPGPLIAIRADMDALPVEERTDLPFASTKKAEYEGQMVPISHACGHDVHVAVQLGVASLLSRMKDQIPGTVMLIFQPAEEGSPEGVTGGAKLMVQEGIFDEIKPKAIFALHTTYALEVGKLGVTSGVTYANTDRFNIEVLGKQTHGSLPEAGIDPTPAASMNVLALQTIKNRNVPSTKRSVVSIVGKASGPTRWNIIPEKVVQTGTVRTLDDETQALIKKRMGEIVEGIGVAMNTKQTLSYETMAPRVINDDGLYKKMSPTLKRVAGEENVSELPPVLGGEDFAFFRNAIVEAGGEGGFFFRLGTTKPGTKSGPNHAPDFRADDASIELGIKAMATVVMDYLAMAPPEPTPARGDTPAA
jgi:amidohydrolase